MTAVLTNSGSLLTQLPIHTCRLSRQRHAITARSAPVFGLGLLEAVAESEILSRADELDADGDGISGAHYVWNYDKKQTMLGRFGWKANQPDLLQQVAVAYNQDIGITSSIFRWKAAWVTAIRRTFGRS